LASELAFSGADRLLSVLPAFILRRVYSKSRLEREVLIDVRTHDGLRFWLTSYVPMVEAWFTVTNFTNLTLKVREASAEIHTEGRRNMITTFYDRPSTINRKQKLDIYTKCMLNEYQVAKLKSLKDQPDGWQIATVYVRAQFESKIGTIEVNPTIEKCSMSIIA